MNLHRYKVKISQISTGDSEFEFLGTWIGLGGMLIFMIDVAMFNDPDEAAANAAICVGLLSLFYWFTTQHKKLLLVFQMSCTIVIIWFLLLLFEANFNQHKMSLVVNLYLCYLSSVSLVAGHYGRKLKHPHP